MMIVCMTCSNRELVYLCSDKSPTVACVLVDWESMVEEKVACLAEGGL